MSAENGIGTAGRLYPVDTPPQEHSERWEWPKGWIPRIGVKNRAENAPKTGRFRQISSTLGEIGGIAAVSAGVWDIYHPAGLITAGIGVFAVSFVSGMPE